MEILKIKPGPMVGHILNALMEEVIDDPSLNNNAYLENRVLELGKFSTEDLRILAEKGKLKKEEEEKIEIGKIRKKHKVS